MKLKDRKMKKVKVDPETQARQALTFFRNLKDAVNALGKLVDYNIVDIEKSIKRFEEKAEKEFESAESENQTKMFN